MPEDRENNEADNRLEQGSIKKAVGAWFWALKTSWQQVLWVDRASITAFQAIRATFGIALPLVLGVATGLTITSVAVASGALMLSAVGLKDPARARGRAMLMASLFVTLSTLVGGLTGNLGWLPVVAIGLWGFVAGLLASTSQVAQVVGVQSCVALIIYAHLGLDPSHALLTAGLVGSGALLQTLLALLPSPWTNTAPERAALATIYQKLAEYATSSLNEQGVLLVTDALQTGHTTLLSNNSRTTRGRMFARLLEEAEHLRLTLSVLLSEYQHIQEKETALEKNSVGDYLEQILRASGEELQDIAHALKNGVPLAASNHSRAAQTLKKALAEVSHMAKVSHETPAYQRILPYCIALRGELHIARRLAMMWRQVRQSWPVHLRFPYPRPPHLHLEDAWSNLRANLTPRSSAFRHALRLGGTLALGMVLYQILHLPVQRGYWIPMTVALVLRSDFITTFTRGIARMLGTILGAVLTTLLLVFLPSSNSLLVLLMILASYLMCATLFANYTIFSAITTMSVVVLLAFTRAPTLATATSRAIDTTLGGLLALLVYALWPTWEVSQVPEYIAQRLEMLGHFLNAVFQDYTVPASVQSNLFGKRQIDSRLARSNALASVQRAQQELEPHRVKLDLAENVLGAADNIARSVLALEAYLLDHPYHDSLPEIAQFSATVDQILTALATGIRARRPASPLPDLQAMLQQIKSACKNKKSVQATTREQWQFMEGECKRIITNIQALHQLLTTDTFA